MRTFLIAALAVLMLVLAACQAPNTEVSSSLPIESPINSLEPISSEEVNGLPDFLSDFTLDYVNGFYMDDNTHYYVHLPDGQKAQQIVSAFDMENWTEVEELPAVSFTVSYNFYDSEGNMISLAPWSPLDEEYCLFSCFSADGSTTVRYHVPRAVYDNVDALLDNSSYLGDISYDASHYYDLFQNDPGLWFLLDSDGVFTDDMLAAYTIEVLAHQGRYDSETGNTEAEFNAVTQKHFGRSIQNFDNGMSMILDSVRVTATGWCGASGVFLVLDGEPVERDGVITARFRCFTPGESFWLDGLVEKEQLDHIREYLLTGNDGNFPAPSLVEITFEERHDEETQAPYVFYHSVKTLPCDTEALAACLEVVQNQREFLTGFNKEDIDYYATLENSLVTLESESTTPQQFLDDWTAENQGEVVFRFTGFALCDLDRDGTPEVLLDISNQSINEGRLILHEENGVVYGFHRYDRAFGGLKTDGTFDWSDGAFHNGSASISFDGPAYQRSDINYCDYSDVNGTMEMHFYVNKVETTEDRFLAAQSYQAAKPSVVWYDFTEEMIRSVLNGTLAP